MTRAWDSLLFYMFGDLIQRAVGNPGIGLGRDAKKGLREIKKVGDRSAHNRRFTARKGDLDKIEHAVRVATEELIVIAMLRADSHHEHPALA